VSTSFEKQWMEISDSLHVGQAINNWGYVRGYTGKSFKISRIETNFIVIDSPSAKNLQRVPKDDFRKVWEIWEAYLSQKVLRNKITAFITRYSSYVISIFHDLKV
jgi:hypothetical protein